jgi:O-antigen/teichoic acid export membrane protein
LVLRALLGAGLVAVLLALVGALAAEPITVLLFGGEFEPAGAPARILLAGLPAYALLGVAWYTLVALEGERSLMLIASAGALVSVIAGVLTIPSHGDLGAAWVYVATLALMAAACLVAIRRRLTGWDRVSAAELEGEPAADSSGAFARY